MRLLIAEDDPKLLKSLVHIFETNHYVADGVRDGDTAFDYASACRKRISAEDRFRARPSVFLVSKTS